ncbi:MAG: RNA methyltransferase [Reyranellaceae bacterium]
MTATSAAPAVVLVRPQLAENIGTAARAMMNCGLSDLRLVAPRDKFPSDKAIAAASGADRIIAEAKVYPHLPLAVADLQRVYAMTARNRDMPHRVVDARQAAGELLARGGQGQRCGILFGPERSGLTNDDLTMADTVITVALNPEHSSLNLAQAVLVLGYELAYLQFGGRPAPALEGEMAPATKEQMASLFEHLERELIECGFLRNLAMRPVMVRNIRTMLQRGGMTDQEVRTFHGIISGLATRRKGWNGPESGAE